MQTATSPLRRALGALALPVALLVAACATDSATTAAPTPAALDVVAGSGQTATVGSALPAALTVRVTTAKGQPVTGVTVTFAVTAGDGTVSPASAVTDAAGLAATQLTLGATAGTVAVTATTRSAGLTATFVATAAAAAASAPVQCGAGATSLATGQALVVASGSSLCVAGGTTGAEYALVPFNGSTVASRRASVSVTAAGVAPVASASLDAADAASATLGDAAALGRSLARVPSAALDLKLHAIAARELAPRMAAARRWYAARATAGSGVRLAVVARSVAVGDVVSLNANADDACTNAKPHGGRVAAVSSRAVVVADTLNPASGYTDADYQSIAAAFDTLVDPVDRAAFGDPTDIDNNGRVVLFFTRSVNELTPANAGWYVGGFFWSRDLFPTTAANPGDACATSNAGEMFYLLVPDPKGTIHGNVFTRTEVTGIVTATLAHEYQHLINSSRRLYVNTSSADWEETWLDEGLAHVAEELVFYQASGLAPRQNVNASTLRRSASLVSAFNEFGIENFGRLESFLESPAANSPYADDDSLATRGATWSFLRYAADHQGTSDGTVWQRLVNSTTSGLANLRGVFGTDLTSLVRDWATSLVLDDVGGADARYQEPSWGIRSIFGALSATGAYPLSAPVLATGVPRAVSVAGGGAAYLRFGVAAGATASLDWGTLPSGVQLTLVRTR